MSIYDAFVALVLAFIRWLFEVPYFQELLRQTIQEVA